MICLFHTAEIKKQVEEYFKRGKKNLNIVISGRVGAGKSSLINGLFGDDVCVEGDTPASVTSEVESHTLSKYGISVSIFDTPGLDDPQKDDHVTIQKIKKQTGNSVDALLFCIRMTERVDTSHMDMVGKLGKALGESTWKKKALFVLTFGNDVKLQKARKRPSIDEDDPEYKGQLKVHFETKLRQFRDALVGAAINHPICVSPDTIKEVPIVPAGYEEKELPDRDDWLSTFWLEVFKRLSPEAQPALVQIAQNRFAKEQVADDMTPSQRPIAGEAVSTEIAKSIGAKFFDLITSPFRGIYSIFSYLRGQS